MSKLNNLLLCVGAQKAGTTWLYNILNKSDCDVEFGNLKELHYFNYKAGISNQLPRTIVRRMAKGALTSNDVITSALLDGDIQGNLGRILNNEWYIGQFRGQKTYAADFTPAYALLEEGGMKRIHETAHKTKVIFIMREPIARAISALKYMHKNNGRTLYDVSKKRLLRQCVKNPILAKSMYHKTIDVIDATFPKSDILYLFFEDVMREKQVALFQMEQFLNIDITSNMSHSHLESQVNKSSSESAPDFVVEELRNKLGHVRAEVENRLGYSPEEWL